MKIPTIVLIEILNAIDSKRIFITYLVLSILDNQLKGLLSIYHVSASY